MEKELKKENISNYWVYDELGGSFLSMKWLWVFCYWYDFRYGWFMVGDFIFSIF